MAVLGVALFIVVLDSALFRAELEPAYIEFNTGPLMPRMWVISVMAGIEEIKFRLVLMSGLAILFKFAKGRLTSPAAVAIIVIAQFANVGTLVMADPLYASLRYWLVGSVWGWLYWRHGWLAALTGHVCAHPVLDPMLKFVLLNLQM